jgi:PAS domain S-box-containing protein
MPDKKLKNHPEESLLPSNGEWEARFRTMFDTAAVGIGMLTLERKLIDANPALCQMFRVSREEFVGRSPVEFTYPDDNPSSARQFSDLVQGNDTYFYGERRYVRKTGEVFWAHVTMSVVRDESGRPLYIVGMLIDIDEQKNTLVELQKSEARFRAIFENTSVGIALIDLDGRPLTVNPAILSMTGYSEQELIRSSGQGLSHPEDRTTLATVLQDLAIGKYKTVEREAQFIRKNGEIFWVRLRASTVPGQEGLPAYIVVMVEDIDEQKRIFGEHEESVRRFQAAFQTTAIGMGLLGLDGRILQVNDAVCKMSGYSREELLERYDWENVYPEDIQSGADLYAELLAGKRDDFQVEKRYMRKNGEVFWTRLTMSAVRSKDGTPLYIVGMIEDIDEQKRVFSELQQSETRFRAMFDNTSVGIALTDLDRQVLQVNEAAARITGYTCDELLQINPIELSLPEDRHIGQDELQAMIRGDRAGMTVERRYMRKNGSIFWGRVTYSLVRNVTGAPQYLIGLIEDINDQKLAATKLAEQERAYRHSLEQRVEERTRELSEANRRLVREIEQRQHAEEALAAKAVDEAVQAERTRLAHDLHDAVTQTLFSASLVAEVLPELWELNPEEARKSNEELRQLTRGALAEMRTLLFELRPAALTQAHFPDLIKQLCDAVIGRARLPVNLLVDGQFELPPDIKVSFYRIAQESLNNIVKYARATQVDIKIHLDYYRVRMQISDNGIGFNPANVKPTSLGMRIMHERAQAIGAKLRISSRPGNGTSVRVDWSGGKQV